MTHTSFDPKEHTITMERKSKRKDAQGRETWMTTKTEYLPCAWRLYWFRLENPKGKIESHLVHLDLERGAAVFETYVEREDGGSARMHGSETQGDWKDYIEKGQTKSLGRALAAVGYGSQFTDDEFNEGERIVDSPVEPTRHNEPTIRSDERMSKPTPDESKRVSRPSESQGEGGQEQTTIPTPLPTLKFLQERCHEAFGAGKWAAVKVKLFGENIPDNDLTPEQLQSMVKKFDDVMQRRAAKPESVA